MASGWVRGAHPIALRGGPMAKTNAYVLDAGLIVQTIERLHARIEARFPGSGLGRVCTDLIEVAKHIAKRAHKLSRPYFAMRLLSVIFVCLWIGLLIYLGKQINWWDVFHHTDVVNFAQSLDSTVNLTLLLGAATWFVWSLEIRLKRRQVFAVLYQLRSMAHIIDMHQLTKDPSVELGNGTITSVSPDHAMSDFELSRYLDYCTEMLSLIAKLAALYTGQTQDSEIIAAANDVEDLTTNLGRKIWQKIMIISNFEKDQPKPA